MTGTALITGGASGIGLALGRRLAAEGWRVLALDRNPEALAALPAPLEGCRLDVTDRAAWSALRDDLARRGETVDLLVNNAGIGVGGEVSDHTAEDWQNVMGVNFFGTLYGVETFYPVMQARRAGTIVNVASVAGLLPLAGEAAYVASKYAVVGLTRVLQVEAHDHGVHVMLVCPGKIETPIYATSPIRGFAADKVLALWPEGISPEDCAAEIARGLRRRRSMVVITRTARLLARIERAAPWLVNLLGRLYIRKMRAYRVAP